MQENINLELMSLIRSTENTIKRTRQLTGQSAHHGNGRIMHAIHDNPNVTQTELARLLDIRPQSLTRELAELEEAGLIQRNREEKDRRIITVSMTEKGMEHHKKMFAFRKMRADMVFDCLEDEEKAQLQHILNKIIENCAEKEAEADHDPAL